MTEDANQRLEYLRGEIRAERISYGEIAELQDLAEFIDPDDVELLQWAGVPEEARLPAERRVPEMAPNLLKQALTSLDALTHYEQEHGDPFGVAESVARPLAVLADVLRRIEDGEL